MEHEEVKRISLKPDSVHGGENIIIDIKKSPTTRIISGSARLEFDFKSVNNNSWFLNNLSKLLVKSLTISVPSGNVVYRNNDESTFNVYKDMWKTKKQRDDPSFGLCREEVRKSLSKADKGGAIFNKEYTKQYIKIGEPLCGNKPQITPDHMNNCLKYEIRLAKAKRIMVADPGFSVEGYTLENLVFQYSTIQDDKNKIYMNPTVELKHDMTITTNEYGRWQFLSNGVITPDKYDAFGYPNTKAIVILFSNTYASPVTDSENYIFPNIESVDVMLTGDRTRHITKEELFTDAKSLFSHSKSGDGPPFMTKKKFFTDGFALVIEGRSEHYSKCQVVKITINSEQPMDKDIKYKYFAIQDEIRMHCDYSQ